MSEQGKKTAKSHAEYPVAFNLADLNGENGYKLEIPFTLNNRPRVSGVGDFNGDGFDDVVVGVPYYGWYYGRSYLIFGAGDGFSAELADGDVKGDTGFRLDGRTDEDISGSAVSGAGDFNGDGLDDLLIGARSWASGSHGEVHLVFGAAGGFGGKFDLGDLDGENGFTINGIASDARIGRSVSNAGDFNGDGFDDIVMGAPSASPNDEYSGQSYVVFGASDDPPKRIGLVNLDGRNGFAINGISAGDGAGSAVSGAGDINADGFDDIIIGAPNVGSTGQSYVVFGTSESLPAEVELADLDGSNGFVLYGASKGDESGHAVSGVGDINGDGFDDLVVGAPGATPNGTDSGQSYLVFGTDQAFPAQIDLADLNGANGFALNGPSDSAASGWSVSGAGDFNGDGFDDILIGAPGALRTYRFYDFYVYSANRGQSYVVFGAPSGFAEPIELGALDGSSGLALNGVSPTDGSGNSVSGTGDVNDDGFDDIVISSHPWYDYSGDGYVVFGGPMLGPSIRGTASTDTLTGTGLGETIRGRSGADKIRGKDGPDTLYGNKGADTIEGGKGADIIDGGPGGDRMKGGPGDDTYYIDHKKDVIVETAKEGWDYSEQDTVVSSISYGLPASIRNLRLAGTDPISGQGNDLGNWLIGNAANNTLKGGDGSDFINGGGGADRMEGGDGKDIYFVDHPDDEVIEGSSPRYETNAVISSISYRLTKKLDHLNLTGNDPIDGEGNARSNRLAGNDTDNRLVGMDGDDSLYGHDGNDQLFGGDGGDHIQGGQGRDKLSGGRGTDALYGQEGSDKIFGNAGKDYLWGDDGNDTLKGGDGSDRLGGWSGRDTLEGGDGNDTITGDQSADLLYGNEGDDRLEGGAGSDSLFGGPGNDNLKGGSGNDILLGRSDADKLIGNGGDDVFKFIKVKDSRAGNQRDKITDFERGADIVDLSRIDARENVDGDQAFDFIGSDEFSRKSGELRFKDEVLSADNDGDGVSDFEVRLASVVHLTEADLVL